MKNILRRFIPFLLALLLAFSIVPGQAAGKNIAELGEALVEAQNAYEQAILSGKSRNEEKALERLIDLQAEHQALLLTAEDELETLMLEYEGKFAYLILSVAIDPEMVIFDLDVAVEGGERDQAVTDLSFLYQFIGKALPLTVGNGKQDDIKPLADAQQTSKDVVAALNELVPEDAKPVRAEKSGPIIEPQDIADYIFAHGELPENFITKKEAQALGWDSSENYVSDVAPGYSIGGDRFGNYEGLLPEKKGRQWFEADCYYEGGRRNAYRILYSSDGLVYYTDDHYETFTQMYPSK